MARRPARDVTVGAVFALALIVLALAVMVVGGDTGPWLERVHYYAVFPDATGLLVGAPVRMAGVQIGAVSDIDLPTDPNKSGIRVTLAIDPAYAPRVRQDSRAALRILQFLTNEKYVLVEPGTMEAAPLEAGATIPRLVEVGVVERGEEIADDLSEVTVALKDILGAMQRGDGLIGKMLTDPNFGKEGLESLRGTLANLDRLTTDLAEGRGALGRLVTDETLAQRLDTLAASMEEFSSIVQALADHQGALGQLLAEGGPAEQALLDLSDAAGSLKRLSASLESDEGLLGRLLNDPDYSRALSEDLETTLASVAGITEKVDHGEGTLGALVNDRTLYDSAGDLVGGVNDSKFARWLMRHYRKKAIKAQEAEGGATEGP